jgi:hypothetical protein
MCAVRELNAAAATFSPDLKEGWYPAAGGAMIDCRKAWMPI